MQTNGSFLIIRERSMKHLLVIILVLSFVFAVAISFAQTKDDCTSSTASAKKSSCCMDHAKASLTSVSMKDSKGSAVDCSVKAMKASDHCTAAEKAKCDMVKASGKMDCCKNKAKGAEAKNLDTKSKRDKVVAEGKGTN